MATSPAISRLILTTVYIEPYTDYIGFECLSQTRLDEESFASVKCIIGYDSGDGNHGFVRYLYDDNNSNANQIRFGNIFGDMTFFGDGRWDLRAANSGQACTITGNVLHTGNFKISSGNLNIDNLTPSYSVHTDSSKNLVSIQNSGTGLNILQTSPTLVTPVISSLTASTLVYANASKTLTSISTGSNTQILTLVAGLPTWTAPATSGIFYY